MIDNRSSTRRLASWWLGGAVVAVVASSLGLVSAPAGAIGVDTTYSVTTPVTWVDGQGRQYEVVSTNDGAVRIARDTATGLPDTTWGPAGTKAVALAPPVAGAGLPSQIAASDDGTLTVAFTAPGCFESGICDRIFARYDGATGALVGTGGVAEDERQVYRTLDDGSVLLGSTETPLRWFGADGTLQAEPGLTGAQIDGADVDASGRLLVLAADSTLTRWTAAHPASPDLTLDTACGPALAGGAVGAAPDGGFAVVCARTEAERLTTTRYDAAGDVSWEVPGTNTAVVTVPAQRVTVDDDDRVWYGGYAPGLFLFTVPSPGRVVVASATASGPEPASYVRTAGSTSGSVPFTDTGGGITDLRTAADGSHVAFADLRVCCRYASNTGHTTASYGDVVPFRPSPPRCPPPVPTITDGVPTDIGLQFTACPDGRPGSRPTGYRVDASGPAGSASSTVADTGAGTVLTASLPGLTAAKVATITVTPFNGLGDTVAPAAPTKTILPFSSLGAFVDQQVADLEGRTPTAAERADFVAGLSAGDADVATFLWSMFFIGGVPDRVAPPARLYRAYFLRDPDTAGLRYWVDRRVSGVRLAAMSEQFARSSEFTRRYGKLANKAFVQLVYQNVLGRPGDAAGIDYWTRKLDGRSATRGAVMAQFSESGESIRRTNGAVRPIVVTYALLGRRTTAAERAAWLTEDDPYRTIPSQIMQTQEYADRVTR
jgi:hypothetical protein